tara:strand:- start:1091 stop:1459 length:369 start_codon:yes stop_codon:yes gene_type:complete
MALTKSPLYGLPGDLYVVQTSATATPDNAVAGGAGVLFQVDIDNTANTDAVYVKLYNNASPTIGSTPPEWVLKCPASVRRVFSCTPGSIFATNLSLACVTTGGTAGTASPTNAVAVRLLLDV